MERPYSLLLRHHRRGTWLYPNEKKASTLEHPRGSGAQILIFRLKQTQMFGGPAMTKPPALVKTRSKLRTPKRNGCVLVQSPVHTTLLSKSSRLLRISRPAKCECHSACLTSCSVPAARAYLQQLQAAEGDGDGEISSSGVPLTASVCSKALDTVPRLAGTQLGSTADEVAGKLRDQALEVGCKALISPPTCPRPWLSSAKSGIDVTVAHCRPWDNKGRSLPTGCTFLTGMQLI